jgi:hypothetical protein
VLGLCRRFSCLPSALLAEDAELLRYLKLEALYAPEEVNDLE